MTNAARQARFRRRQARGLAIVPAEVDLLGLADALVAAGYLSEKDATDFQAIVNACSVMLADFVMRYSAVR